MPLVQIIPSVHGTPDEVVAVEERQIVWAGPISALKEAGTFDALYCHEDDEEKLIGLMHGAEKGRRARRRSANGFE
jgi:hypothetical protein